QTTFFAGRSGTEKYSMMFFSEDLKVILATIHVSLASVPGLITPRSVRTAVENALSFGSAYEGREYSVAVCGLNPHSGENGLMGSEDKDIIAPVVREYRERGLRVE